MRNRAKCKLCNDVIEGNDSNEFVFCKCKHIGVMGISDPYKCLVTDWDNFIRIDDEDREVIPKIVEPQEPIITPEEKKDRLLAMFKGLIDSYESLPSHAKLNPITHYDMQSALFIMYEILIL